MAHRALMRSDMGLDDDHPIVIRRPDGVDLIGVAGPEGESPWADDRPLRGREGHLDPVLATGNREGAALTPGEGATTDQLGLAGPDVDRGRLGGVPNDESGLPLPDSAHVVAVRLEPRCSGRLDGRDDGVALARVQPVAVPEDRLGVTAPSGGDDAYPVLSGRHGDAADLLPGR